MAFRKLKAIITERFARSAQTNATGRRAGIQAVYTTALLTALPGFSHGFDWTSNNVQAMYGSDFELGSESRGTFTVEHADGWRYGQNFFFVDTIVREDVGTEVYAEVYSYLSLKKTTGMTLDIGPIQDVSLMLGLNIGNQPKHDNFKGYLAGVSFDLTNRFTDYLQLSVSAYKADDVGNRYGLQITPVWSVPFEIGPARFKLRGFTDFSTANTNAPGHFMILAQPQFLYDVGHAAGWKRDALFIGTEYMLWHNKFGIQGIDEAAMQGMIIGFF